jgi:hypothetical protein
VKTLGFSPVWALEKVKTLTASTEIPMADVSPELLAEMSDLLRRVRALVRAENSRVSEARRKNVDVMDVGSRDEADIIQTNLYEAWPASRLDALRRALTHKPADARLALEWREGAPPHPWDKEWFIALTTYGDRVVLRALPEDYTYDFKTADDTYIKRDKIAKWMQFPDSEYVAPTSALASEAW